ncbi:MAG: ADP-ribosylglycohydrolase family protein [Thermoleophilia bacterium]|nr:ADP-ribosylglycohydrolase family protein [Thermoleophilia bacterium]
MVAELANYEEQVYAGVLGKVIGVYMGRPIEGWTKDRIVDRFGFVDRYLAAEVGQPLVVADDDISGTFTFIRALEDSGLLAETPPDFFGKTWLNYLIENKTILWWGGRGVSTEHTAYLNLKEGVPSPDSGSAELNGKIVAEQIGAQIFIDAFGLIAPGDPELAVRLACPAAQVSHDGEAVHAAMIVAALVSAAFVEKDMDRLLDTAIGFIPADSLIAQLHRDVRAWCRQDDTWEQTYDRIAERYGYDAYGGGCHVIPNHAIMVMAWCYAPDDFLRSQTIINTAGWDTDCNAANVGCVMGVKLGLDRVNEEYDFQSPFADRIILPTAEGSRHVTDCLTEALRLATLGRTLMGWSQLTLPKARVWHHFSLPRSRHGYVAEDDDLANVTNVQTAEGGRALRIVYDGLDPNRPLRVSTPILAQAEGRSYSVVGSPRLYPGYTITLEGRYEAGGSPISGRLFVRHCVRAGEKEVTSATLCSDATSLLPNKRFDLSFTIPEVGFPIKDFGIELTGDSDAAGSVLVQRVSYTGVPDLHMGSELVLNQDGQPMGWVSDLDVVRGNFTNDNAATRYFGKNKEIGILVTGTDDWTDYTISALLTIHSARAAGLLARYQGLQRYLALIQTRDTLRLVLNYYGERTLAETPHAWPAGERRPLTLSVQGATVSARVDGQEVLSASDDTLLWGGAGFVVDRGLAGFRELAIEGS